MGLQKLNDALVTDSSYSYVTGASHIMVALPLLQLGVFQVLCGINSDIIIAVAQHLHGVSFWTLQSLL